MNNEPGVGVRWGVLAVSALLLVTMTALGTSVFLGRYQSDRPTDARAGTREAPLPVPDAASVPDASVTLTDEAVRRAGIEVVTVEMSDAVAALRLPGVVHPNAYRSISAVAVVGGRVTDVFAELGQQVRRGQTLAEVYAPELADAQTRYLSVGAELVAHEQALRRVEKLVDIGAASRQELERVHAEHTAATTMVENSRSRLVLLGMTDADLAGLTSALAIRATVHIPAPADGVVTMREANVGLNVEAGARLFTVVDLSTVWIVGDLYEKDFSRVGVGNSAAITTTAYPGLTLAGRVSYIDPRVHPETRTAAVRVEVPNPRGDLRLGMFAEMLVRDAGQHLAVVLPRSAVQLVGDRSVVYLARPSEPGHFVEREVQLGDVIGEDIEVRSGVLPGDVVVSKGTFSLRAQRERLGLRPGASGSTAHPVR